MKKILLLCILVFTYYHYYLPNQVITHAPGEIAPDQPEQNRMYVGKQWKVGEYTIKALAEYHIKARVLSRKNYTSGKEAELSPVDFALGWGPMSDQKVLDQINISQSNRWYFWNTQTLPIPVNSIEVNSANVHIIPRNDDVKQEIDDVKIGSLVEMKGYLVEVITANGWRWVSSLTRRDTGNGACEVFAVDQLNVLDN